MKLIQMGYDLFFSPFRRSELLTLRGKKGASLLVGTAEISSGSVNSVGHFQALFVKACLFFPVPFGFSEINEISSHGLGALVVWGPVVWGVCDLPPK